MKNILLTNMSTLKPEMGRSIYYGLFDNGVHKYDVRYCYGIGQLEAGTKYFLSKVDIDKIIIVSTEATAEQTTVTIMPGTDMEETKKISPNQYYKDRILEFLKETEKVIVNGDEKKTMVPTENNKVNFTEEDFITIQDVASPDNNAPEVDNVQGIVNAILKTVDSDDEKINLYIDMQGGIRTSGFVRNAVLSIVGNERDSRVEIQEIIATEYNHDQKVSKIVDETKRYKIMDLAAAMNAFVRYGKVDLLKKYCEERKVYPVKYDPNTPNEDRKHLGNLLWLMEKVDDSISLCNVKGLDEAIKGMKSLLSQKNGMMSYKHEYDDDRVFVKSVFDILIDGIERDYGKVLTATGDEYVLELISWCTRKGFLQQALTLVEDQMPKVFLKKEADVQNDKYVMKYKKKSGYDLKRFGEKIGQTYYDEENNLFYMLDNKLFLDSWSTSTYSSIASNANYSVTGNSTLGMPADVMKEVVKNSPDQIDMYDTNIILSDTELATKANDLTLAVATKDLKTFLDEGADKFTDKYYEFQICNKEFEEGKTVKSPASYYYKIKHRNAGMSKPFLTLVHYEDYINGTQFGHYIKNQNGYQLKNSSIICIKVRKVQDKRRLDDLLMLHSALKLERNCTNHASDKGIRLSASVVKRALEIYVEEARYFVN